MPFGYENDNACINDYMRQITTFSGVNRMEIARNDGGNFR